MKFILFCLLTLFVCSQQQVPLPLPKKYHGHSFGNKLADVKLEIFLNIPCPYTTKFWEGAGRFILENYVKTNKINLIIHQFPLPYIVASFESSKSVYVVEKYQKNKLLDFIDFAIMNGQLISSRTVFNNTGSEIRDLIYNKLVSGFSVSKNDYNKEMYGSDFAILQRDAWKFGASHGISGTPNFVINGVYFSAENLTKEYWQKVMKTLVDKKTNFQSNQS
eukprot:gene6962-11124_t